MAMTVSHRKRAGAYYTSSTIARFLANWAIRAPQDRILEPCFGEGVFLRAAADRLREMGGDKNIVGVDVDSETWRSVRAAFEGIALHNSDFFELTPDRLGLFDAVIGNPPFIRYHHFSGKARARALQCAARVGVGIPALTSAWAPFLIHAARHLRSGGRLAVVAPYEITYARYARPVVEFLARSFQSVHCLVFTVPLFPDLNESTVLLMCDGFGGSTSSIAIHHLASAESLKMPLPDPTAQAEAVIWASGSMRARLFDLSATCRDLYTALVERPEVIRLGQVAEITIGYVSGDNGFFHLTADGVKRYGLAPSDLRIAVRRGADLSTVGIALTREDAMQLASHAASWLFLPNEPLNAAALSYVSLGSSRKVHQRYKCRVRHPWYKVPGVRVPEMLLSVFSSAGPRLLVNQAEVVATNSILTVDRIDAAVATAENLAAAAVTTLSQLSAEVEGHSLGGGALKLEPSEARRLALPARIPGRSAALTKIDSLLRQGQTHAARIEADELILIECLGLDYGQLAILREGLERLRGLRDRGQSIQASSFARNLRLL